MYDLYRSKSEPDERMATISGAGLPDHIDPDDWELMIRLAALAPPISDIRGKAVLA
jgi:hypothetical protein